MEVEFTWEKSQAGVRLGKSALQIASSKFASIGVFFFFITSADRKLFLFTKK